MAKHRTKLPIHINYADMSPYWVKMLEFLLTNVTLHTIQLGQVVVKGFFLFFFFSSMIPLSCIGWFDEVKKELKEEEKNQITSPRSESNLHNLHCSRFFHSHFILSSSNFLKVIISFTQVAFFIIIIYHFKIPSPLINELQVIEASLPEVPFCIFKLYNRAKKTTKWM